MFEIKHKADLVCTKQLLVYTKQQLVYMSTTECTQNTTCCKREQTPPPAKKGEETVLGVSCLGPSAFVCFVHWILEMV